MIEEPSTREQRASILLQGERALCEKISEENRGVNPNDTQETNKHFQTSVQEIERFYVTTVNKLMIEEKLDDCLHRIKKEWNKFKALKEQD